MEPTKFIEITSDQLIAASNAGELGSPIVFQFSKGNKGARRQFLSIAKIR
jgi:hypothetical protein